MGERQSGPAALCGFRLSNSLAIQVAVTEMGGIDGVLLGYGRGLYHTDFDKVAAMLPCMSQLHNGPFAPVTWDKNTFNGVWKTMQWGKKQRDYIIQKAFSF